MPGCSGVTVVTNSYAFYHLHTRLRAHRAPGIPCALSSEGAGLKRKPRAKTCGEIAKSCPSRHHPRKRVIQYSVTSVIGPKGRGVLDTPLSRGMTDEWEERMRHTLNVVPAKAGTHNHRCLCEAKASATEPY